MVYIRVKSCVFSESIHRFNWNSFSGWKLQKETICLIMQSLAFLKGIVIVSNPLIEWHVHFSMVPLNLSLTIDDRDIFIFLAEK